MTTARPRLAVFRSVALFLAACGLAPLAAGDLIRRGAPADLAPRVSQPLVLTGGVLARERVEVDASVLAPVPETLWLELEPGETRLAVLVDSVRTPDGGLVWRGRFLADDPGYRSIVLSLHDGLLRGSFDGGDVSYLLQALPGGASELVTLAPHDDLHCGVDAETPRDPEPSPPLEAHDQGGAAAAPGRIAAAAAADRTFAILVLYAPSVGERWGGRRFVVSYAHHAVDSLNTAFANSRIDGAAFLAGVEEWRHMQEERNRILDEVRRSSEVGALRDQAGADLVVVLTDDESSSSFERTVCGVANVMTSTRRGSQMAPFAFSLTVVDCETHNHSVFVHEIGHNLGANHLPGRNAAPPPHLAAFPYAFAHAEGSFRSVMVGRNSGKLVFSNPTVIVDGDRAGIEGERDNARVLNQMIPFAAAFRSGGSEVPRENVPPPGPEPPVVTPAQPTRLGGTVLSATAVRLSWEDNTIDEIGYRVEARKEPGGGAFEAVAETPANNGPHVVTQVVEGLEPATRYRFRVIALGEQRSSAPSNEIVLTTLAALPEAPVGLTATATSSGTVALAWEPVERASGYEVEVRTADPAADRPALPIVLAPGGATVDGLEPATPYTFRVRARNALGASDWSAGASATTSRAAGPCVAGGTSLCLLGERFEVQARWRNPHPPFGHGVAAAQAAPGSDVTGFFTFFDPRNVELAVKILDGRGVNGAFWHFYGALSDVEYWISVFDTANGTSRTYHNEPFSLCGQGDTGAFPEASSAAAAARPAPLSSAGADSSPETRLTAPAAGSCAPDEHALCLADGRFRVEVDWVNPHAPDSRGAGTVFAGAETDLSGHFWFFTPDNLELSVKILDGREVNGHHWIFWGGLSDVGYTLQVTDTETGETHELTNPPGTFCGGAVLDLL